MARLERSDRAAEDLIEIWTYIAEQNQRAADEFLDEIEDLCRLIARSPMLGRAREELAPGLRSFPVGDYLIFYQPRKDGITIIRVLSGYRDIDLLFEDHDHPR